MCARKLYEDEAKHYQNNVSVLALERFFLQLHSELLTWILPMTKVACWSGAANYHSCRTGTSHESRLGNSLGQTKNLEYIIHTFKVVEDLQCIWNQPEACKGSTESESVFSPFLL